MDLWKVNLELGDLGHLTPETARELMEEVASLRGRVSELQIRRRREWEK